MMTNENNRQGSSTHIFFGDDEPQRTEAVQELLDQICPKDKRSLGLEIIEGEASNADAAVAAVKECIEALQTLGFLTDGKTVWLRNANFMDTSNVAKAAAVKDILKALSKLISDGIGAGCHLVISAEKIYKGSAFFKQASKLAEIHEFKLDRRASHRNHVSRDLAVKIFKEKGVGIIDNIAETFIKRCGNDGRRVRQEVEKLCLYVGDRRKVTQDDIDILTTSGAESEFWELGDSIAKRDKHRALHLARKERERGGNPVGMVIGIEKMLLQLLAVRECQRSGLLSIINNNGHWKEDGQLLDGVFSGGIPDLRTMHSYRVAMLAKDSNRYTRPQLRNGLKLAIAAHEKMVSSSLPEFTVLEILIQDITG